MIRKDRQLTDITEILNVIDQCKVIRIGMYDEGEIYVLPLNFGYTYENEELVFYFHSALKGKKLEIIQKNPKVGFELDCEHELIEGKVACQYGFKFASVVGNAVAEIVKDPQEKMKAMTLLMMRQTGKEFEFNERLVTIVEVVKITATSFTGKRRRSKKD